jgi:hypothetical protein
VPSFLSLITLFVLAAGSSALLGGCVGKTNKPEFALLYGNAMTIKHGQTEAEVIDLLGKPNETVTKEDGNGKVLSFYSGSPIDNNIMIVITDGKVTGGMATKNGEVTTFARDAAHSQPATGGRPKAPPSFSGKAPGP